MDTPEEREIGERVLKNARTFHCDAGLLWERVSRFHKAHGKYPPPPLIMRMAANTAVDEFRKTPGYSRRTKKTVQALSLDADPEPGGLSWAERFASAELSQKDRDDRALVEAFVKTLPPRDAYCLIEWSSGEVTLAELGDRFEITAARVSQIIHSIRAKWREFLQADGCL